MSNYQYQRGNRNNGDLTYWILAVVFLVCMPPIGFFMIVLKLLGGKKRTEYGVRSHQYHAAEVVGSLG